MMLVSVATAIADIVDSKHLKKCTNVPIIGRKENKIKDYSELVSRHCIN